MFLKSIIESIPVECSYDKNCEITSMQNLPEAGPEMLSFEEKVTKPEHLMQTKAEAAFVTSENKHLLNKSTQAIITQNPHLAAAYATKLFYKDAWLKTGPKNISDTAIIHPEAKIGAETTIGNNVTVLPGAVIGPGVIIGNNTVIHANVTIYPDCNIGRDVIIHSNTVIGCDGYGYQVTPEGKHIKIYHLGNVIIGDEVEIGSCCTVDRSEFGATEIKNGAKLDNLVHIAHNCIIGEGSILTGQVGLGGSTVLGHHVIMAGKSAAVDHVHIGDGAIIAAKAGVTKSLPGGQIYGGYPAVPHKKWIKSILAIQNLIKKNKKNK
jgi:UDP-3-O-[3-hydroxymyristoyl] glucosamine N-acyltransferase